VVQNDNSVRSFFDISSFIMTRSTPDVSFTTTAPIQGHTPLTSSALWPISTSLVADWPPPRGEMG